MMRKQVLPVLALIGVVLAVYMIYLGSQKPPVAPILFVPPVSPYKHYIAAQGVVESAYKNVLIGVPFPELVIDLYVAVGDLLKKGDKLFLLDTRKLEAQLVQALKEQDAAQVEYERQKTEFSFYKRLCDTAAVSEQSYAAAGYAQQLALERLLVAQARVQVIRTDIERSIIRAPLDGQVLQVNIKIGSSANINPFSNTPLMLFGDVNVCHLRVEIDEADAWRVIRGAPATAFVRGNAAIRIPLEFVYLEPYVIPKTQLTGANVERVDTRVLQVVYKFPNNTYPVYMGQLLDVFLEAQPSGVAE